MKPSKVPVQLNPSVPIEPLEAVVRPPGRHSIQLAYERGEETAELNHTLVRRDKPMATQLKTMVRHEGDAPRERSTCGWRDRLISREDADVAAWVHAVDIDGAREHYHKQATELYYVLDGEGFVVLDGQEHAVRKGSLVHIPPGVVHGARGRMRVLVTGIPNIADDDLFYPDNE